MIKEISFYEFICDRCSTKMDTEDADNLYSLGWVKVGEEVFCKECIKYYSSIKPQTGDKVVCLIDDDERHLHKGRNYSICETIYDSDRSTVTDEDRKNNAIYIDVGNGWQSKLLLTQYDRID